MGQHKVFNKRYQRQNLKIKSKLGKKYTSQGRTKVNIISVITPSDIKIESGQSL